MKRHRHGWQEREGDDSKREDRRGSIARRFENRGDPRSSILHPQPVPARPFPLCLDHIYLRKALRALGIVAVVLLAGCAAPSREGPYQATGMKIGEVTDTEAIIWTRLTQVLEQTHAVER